MIVSTNLQKRFRKVKHESQIIDDSFDYQRFYLGFQTQIQYLCVLL